MALEKASPPGIITLSPLCIPEIDKTMAESSVVNPVTLTVLIVYSFGTLEFWSASRSGSTEVTFVVSWPYEIEVMSVHKLNVRIPDKNRRI